MQDTLGFGLLGAGLVAPFHVKGIAHSPGGRLVAVCDTQRARADALAAQAGVRAYYQLEDMLADPAVQVVNVVTPNHLHHDAVLACAAAGRHVITEKPPAMTLADTDRMVEACEQAGVRLACTVQCRVRKAIRAVREAVEAGRFGRVLEADAIMKWFRSAEYYHSDAWRSSRQSGAGVTIQHAFHYIDLLLHLAGPVTRVEARMSNLNHPSVRLEDSVAAFLTFANGARGLVQASTALWPGSDVRIELHGTEGTAVVTGERMTTWAFRTPSPEDETHRSLGCPDQATAAGSPTDFGYQDHQVVIQDMIESIRDGREVSIPVRSVRPTLEVALAMYQSDALGRPVDLPIRDDPSIWES